MAKVVLNTEIDTKSLLHSLAHLRISELEEFAKELNNFIKRQKLEDRTAKDKELLLQINQTVLPRKQRERYLELVHKMEQETITEEERKIYLQLATMDDQLRNQRVKLMIELAELREIPFNQLMEDLGLQPIANV